MTTPFPSERIISTNADEVKAIYTADIDSDGDIDILSASSGDDKIAWYENNGREGFTERIISTSADGVESVYAADVDGDGDIDVLSASRLDDKIAWYENNGSEGFAERIISTDAIDPMSIFAVDVDGDGDMDVLSASSGDAKIAWYENNGSGGFTERIISANADMAISVHAADVDGDGDMDVLSASLLDGKVAWYENNGSEGFTEQIIFQGGVGASAVYAADVDGDGDIDVLSTSLLDDKVAWHENDGRGGFIERIITTNADGASAVYAADVDGDGDTDVLAASSFDNKIAWYGNTPVVSLEVDGTTTESSMVSSRFTLVRSGTERGEATVTFSVSGSATFGEDYRLTGADTFDGTTGTLTLADGQTTATLMITPIDENQAEGVETISIALLSGDGYSLDAAATTATLNITDNDVATFQFSADTTTLEEGTSRTITLARNANIETALTVSLTSSNPTAVTVPQQVTFAAGEDTTTFTIAAVDDELVEGTQTTILTAIADDFVSPSIELTVTDNDTAPVNDDDDVNEDDFIKGTPWHDCLNGGAGNDTLIGYSGHDWLEGGKGNDLLKGGKGNDFLKGGKGQDILKGGKGNDLLKGGKGQDILQGGKGHDILLGGAEEDALYGGKGHDTLYGGAGYDVLTGGKGHDLFVLAVDAASHVPDVITDFDLRQDTIELKGGLSFDQLTIYQGSDRSSRDTFIQVTQTGDLLARLENVKAHRFVQHLSWQTSPIDVIETR